MCKFLNLLFIDSDFFFFNENERLQVRLLEPLTWGSRGQARKSEPLSYGTNTWGPADPYRMFVKCVFKVTGFGGRSSE